MKVLIATGLYPPELGGPATYTAVLEKELPRRGVLVSVLPFSRVRALPKIIRHAAYFWQAFRLAKDADLVYAQDPVSVGLPALLAARIAGKPFLLKVVGDYAWEQATARWRFSGTLEEFQSAELLFLPNALRALERFVARRAKKIVVPSNYLAGIVGQWGIRKRRVAVIYNGMEELADPGNKPVLRGLLKFRGKLVVSVGRLVPWKGFDELIALLPRLKKTVPDAVLMIIGAGPEFARLESFAAERGVLEDVIFTGALPRDVLLRYLRLSDVFVLNSRYEGFSHQLLEAMAVGVPVIATKVGGNPEAVTDGENGFLIAPGDRAKLLSRISALLSDAPLRARVVSAGRKTARRFSDERMLAETIRLFNALHVGPTRSHMDSEE